MAKPKQVKKEKMGTPKESVTRYARVCTRIINFNWKIDGFKNIPFTTGHPIYSSPFTLGCPTDSVFQVLMIKEIKVLPIAKDEGRDKKFGPKGEPVARPSEVIQESKKEAAVHSPSKGVSTRSMKLKSVVLVDNIEEEEGIKSKTIGFLLMRTSEGAGWETADHEIHVKFGKNLVKAESIEHCKSVGKGSKSYKYICDVNHEKLDLFETEDIDIEVKITHKILEEDPLYNPRFSDEVEKMARECNEFRKANKYANMILTCGEVEMPCHMSILCVRTYYFDCEYQDERIKNKAELKVDTDKTVLEAMLKFMYTGGIPFTLPIEKVPGLYSAAKQYGVDFLPDICSEYFKVKLDPEVCLDCLGIISVTDNFAKRAGEMEEERLKEILAKQPCNHEK